MERIGVFKDLKGFARFFIIFGTIFTIISVSLLIRSFLSGFSTQFPSGDWNSVLFTVQGVLFLFMGYSNLKNKKYYIEWDEKELRFLLPDSKQLTTIFFTEIKSVRIKLFEIELTLIHGTKTLNLENLQFEDLKRIKKKFEEISVPDK